MAMTCGETALAWTFQPSPGAGHRIGIKLLAEIDYIARPYELLFHAEDHLGSSRVTFNENGGIEDNIRYLPFGKLDLLPTEGEIDTTHLFTGHERDPGQGGSGLDYMHQRYYSPILGRFISVDPVMGDTGSSQSYNRYSYVENNPLKLVDPDGLLFSPVSMAYFRDRVAENLEAA